MIARVAHARPVPIVVAFALAVGAAGCGSSSKKAGHDSVVVPVAVDCSPSMIARQDSWSEQITRIAGASLAAKADFMAGCFSGSAASVRWSLNYPGKMLPKLTGGQPAIDKWASDWAAQLVPLFTRQLAAGTKPGTNWLGALQACSHIENTNIIYLFSDLVQDANGINLLDSRTEDQLETYAADWAPKLSALKGHTVYAVGGGQGTQHPEAAQRGAELLRLISVRVSFTVKPLTVLGSDPAV